jgi:hypothetical protein
MTCGIYLITGVAYSPSALGDNGYFGLSKNIELRSGQHFSALRNDKHPNPHLQHYANKYGIDNLQMKIIFECKPDELPLYEKEYIANANTYYNSKGFNLTPGGDGVAAEVNALPFHFRNAETGEEVRGENVNDFCRIHPELNRDCMYRVKNGKQKIHKGWYAPEHCAVTSAIDLLEPYERKNVEDGLSDTEDVGGRAKGEAEK